MDNDVEWHYLMLMVKQLEAYLAANADDDDTKDILADFAKYKKEVYGR